MKRIYVKPFMVDFKGQEVLDQGNPIQFNDKFRISLYEEKKEIFSEVVGDIRDAVWLVRTLIKNHEMPGNAWDLPTGFNSPAFAEFMERVPRDWKPSAEIRTS